MHLDYYLKYYIAYCMLSDSSACQIYTICMCINTEPLDDYCHYCGMISSHDDQTYLVCTYIVLSYVPVITLL